MDYNMELQICNLCQQNFVKIVYNKLVQSIQLNFKVFFFFEIHIVHTVHTCQSICIVLVNCVNLRILKKCNPRFYDFRILTLKNK